MTDIVHLKEKLAQACRVIGLLDLTKATTGHSSLRIPGTDKVLIRARGDFESGVRYTTADDIITIDLQGRKLEGREDLDPPRETFIHTWLYRTRPNIGAVVHAHPPTLVLFTVCKKPLLPIYGGYDPSSLRMLTEGLPTYPRSVTVTNDKLGEEFAAAMGKRACLMRGHGITTIGPDIEDASLTTIKLNHLAEMNFKAYQLGDPEPIPAEDIAAFSKSKTVKDNAPVWNYYCKLVGEEMVAG